eukprot:Lankesteria_metandrocarpae@DN475_c0_g1_i1.p1
MQPQYGGYMQNGGYMQQPAGQVPATSTVATQASGDNGWGTDTIAIIAVMCAGMVLLMCICLGFCFCMMKGKMTKEERTALKREEQIKSHYHDPYEAQRRHQQQAYTGGGAQQQWGYDASSLNSYQNADAYQQGNHQQGNYQQGNYQGNYQQGNHQGNYQQVAGGPIGAAAVPYSNAPTQAAGYYGGYYGGVSGVGGAGMMSTVDPTSCNAAPVGGMTMPITYPTFQTSPMGVARDPMAPQPHVML